MKYYVLLLVFVKCVSVFNCYSQENLLYNEIQQDKKEGIEFKNLSPFTYKDKSVQKRQEFQKYFNNPEDVHIIKYNKFIQKDLTSKIDLHIPFGTREGLQLELKEEVIDFVIKTSDGQKIPSNKNIKHYRGIIKDNPNSLVSLTFGEEEVLGLIMTENGNFNLSLNKQLGEYILYNDNNIQEKIDFTCGTDDDFSFQYDVNVLKQQSKISVNTDNSSTKFIRLYFETEFDIFQTRGSIASVETFITGIYNQVATLYRNENIITALSELFIWNTQDPYTSTTTIGLLNQFQNNRTSINGDLGHLLTFRNIGGGEAAGVNGLCNSNTSQKLAVSMLYNIFQNIPNYSWSVCVVTHEFGHLFGSRHTHACVWNGNNTAIDGCAETEGSCSKPKIPSGGGTIMSYCHQQSVGINFNLGFGPQPGNVIRNRVDIADCLLSITGPSQICSQATYTINPPDGATVTWSATPHLFSPHSGTGTTAVVGPAGTMSQGKGLLTFTITVGGSSYAVSKEILVGGDPPQIYGLPPYMCSRQSAIINVSPSSDGYYYWEIAGGRIISGQGTETLYFETDMLPPYSPSSSVGVYVQVHGECGNTLVASTSVPVEQCEGGGVISSLIYPNPATDVVTVELREERTSDDALSIQRTTVPVITGTYEIQLWSASAMLRRYTTDQPVYQIPVSGLPAGIYFVRVIKDGQTHTKKLIKR